MLRFGNLAQKWGKYKNLFRIRWIMALFFVSALLLYQSGKEYRMQQSIAKKVLRFHVRANSDGEWDQRLKLKVRDAVGGYMEKELQGATDLESCQRTAAASLSRIQEIAEQTLRKEGCPYPVEVKLEETVFPKKTYGDYTFPRGRYQALNVVIGSGKGHNWWCVLYPNMCFHGAVYEVVGEESNEALRRTLTPEEYQAVLRKGNYRIRFRSFQLFFAK